MNTDSARCLFDEQNLPEQLRTPSSSTNRLIACCLGVHMHQVPPVTLQSMLDASARELLLARDNFHRRIESEPELVESIGQAIQDVLDTFHNYVQALTYTKSWFSHPQTYTLDRAAIIVRDGYLELNQSLLHYEWAYLTHGDEPHPALNLMQKVVKGIHAGTMSDDRLDDILDRLWSHFSAALETFDKSSNKIQANHGIMAIRQVLAGIQNMDQYFDDHDIAVLCTGYGRFRQGCLLLVEQIQDRTGEALAQGPTPSPQVNWVIHATRAVQDGLSPSLLQRAQAWFEPQLAESYFRFEQNATQALEGPARMAEAVPVARKGFDKLNRSLPLLRLGLERRQMLSKSIQYLEDGAKLLNQAWQVFTELEESESRTQCIRCGAYSPAVSRVCSSCGAALVLTDAGAASAPAASVATANAPEAPAHLAKLLSACEDVERGRITVGQFEAVVSWGRQLLRSAYLGVSRLPEQTEHVGAATALSTLRQGMEEFGAALEELQLYVNDRRPVHLTVGSRMLIKACDRFAAVQTMAQPA